MMFSASWMWLHLRYLRWPPKSLLQLNERQDICEKIEAEILGKSLCSIIHLGAVIARRMHLIIVPKAAPTVIAGIYRIWVVTWLW